MTGSTGHTSEKKKTKRKAGRPKKVYNQALLNQIIILIQSEDYTLRKISEEFGIPLSTIASWLQKNTAFFEQYTRAKNTQIDLYLDQIIEKIQNFKLTNDNKLANAEIQKLRLEIDSIKWIAAKRMPQKYGDKLQVEHTGDKEAAQRMHNALERVEALARGRQKKVIDVTPRNPKGKHQVARPGTLLQEPETADSAPGKADLHHIEDSPALDQAVKCATNQNT